MDRRMVIDMVTEREHIYYNFAGKGGGANEVYKGKCQSRAV